MKPPTILCFFLTFIRKYNIMIWMKITTTCMAYRTKYKCILLFGIIAVISD
jgi:hypothetical protein